MIEEKKLVFFDKLTAILKGNVNPKSEETLHGELFCDWLKLQISKLFEQTHRLDLFSDEFNFSEFLAQNIEYPLERMKVQMEKTWLRDKLTIALMGHFTTGKTTALNILFDEAFQTNRHENTALATYLTHGKKQDHITLVDRAGQSQKLTLEQCSILDYSEGVRDFPFARIFDYMVKENDHSLLKELTVIDTPGLFATKTGHSAPTMNVVSSCDAIFWFINVTTSLTSADIKVIKESLAGLPLYIVFSYVDARGTNVSQVDSAISSMLKALKKEGIEPKGHLKLGKSADIQAKFKSDALSLLKRLASENEVYDPSSHILAVINFLEDFLVKCQKQLRDLIGEVESETDRLLSDYRSSSRSFATECSNCINRLNNMVDTVNSRCSNVMVCTGTYNVICNNINSVQSSFKQMLQAYDDMDVSKLVEYGNGMANKSRYQNLLDSVSDILKNVKKLKDQLK